jgi:hypothetical protein
LLAHACGSPMRRLKDVEAENTRLREMVASLTYA